MQEPPSPEDPGETGRSQPQVRIRYWAAARAAAGTAEDVIAARTVADALAGVRALRRDNPGLDRFERVLSICSLLLDEQPLGGRDHASVAVADGDVIDVLPPFAGG